MTSGQDCVFIADTSARVISSDKNLCAACGLGEAEFVGRPLEEIARHFGAPAAFGAVPETAITHLCEMSSKEGMKQTFELSLVPVRDKGGAISSVVGRVRDVTDETRSQGVMKKYAEGLALLYELSALFLNARGLKEALTKALAMVRNYYDADCTHVLFPDPGGQALEVYAGAEDTRGIVIPVSHEDQAGATLLDQCPVIVMDYSKEARYSLSEYYATLGIRSGVCVPMSAEGRVTGVLCIYYKEPREIDTGGLWYMNVVANSLAVYIEKERSLEKLGKSEAFLSSVLEGIGEGVVVIDRDFNILSANNSYYEQVKYSPEEAVGLKCYQISHRIQVPCFEAGDACAVKKVFETGRAQSEIHIHKDKLGNPVHVETNAYPIFDGKGDLVSAVETLTNITERMRLEKDIEKRVRELEDFYEMAVGRELKMIELKESIEALRQELKRLGGQ